MAVDLKTNEKAMLAAFEDVCNDSTPNDWWENSPNDWSVSETFGCVTPVRFLCSAGLRTATKRTPTLWKSWKPEVSFSLGFSFGFWTNHRSDRVRKTDSFDTHCTFRSERFVVVCIFSISISWLKRSFVTGVFGRGLRTSCTRPLWTRIGSAIWLVVSRTTYGHPIGWEEIEEFENMVVG